MADVHYLPAPALRVVEQSPAGRHEFDEVERERVEITAGLNKTYAVRVDTAIWEEFNTDTNAIRCATLLREMDRRGALPSPKPSVLWAQLKASLDLINGPGDAA